MTKGNGIIANIQPVATLSVETTNKMNQSHMAAATAAAAAEEEI